MKQAKEFYQSARALARNPLGIIALFIILVYAVASVVISLAKPEFYANPWHPFVLFLAAFPVVVLFVFAYLVARHHGKLYSPKDFENQEGFLQTLAKPPKALTRDHVGVATSDESMIDVVDDVRQNIDNAYAQLREFGFCLLHEAEVIQPRSAQRAGQFRARVWVEPITHRSMSDIISVTYRVWDDFNQTVLTTSDHQSNFDLWLNIYGEFPVLALVKTRDGQEFMLQRYLDLPGRPTD